MKIRWVDILKGIGILLVVVGHTPINGDLKSYIYSFHMPLFFFISGFLYAPKKYPKAKNFVIARTKSLLIPYFSFSILAILLFVFRLFIGNQKGTIPFKAIMNGLFLSRRNEIMYNVPIWFLTSLFTVTILYYFARKWINNDYLLAGFLIFLSVFSYLNWNSLGTLLPWSFDGTLYYIIFYGVGSLIRENKNQVNQLVKNYTLYISLVLNIIILYLKLTKHLDNIINTLNFNPYIVQLFLGFNGVFAFIMVSKLIKKSSILEFLGKNTLTIMSLHVPLAFLIMSKIIHKVLPAMPSNLYGFILTVSSVLFLVPIIIFINRKLPFLLGRLSAKSSMSTAEKVSI